LDSLACRGKLLRIYCFRSLDQQSEGCKRLLQLRRFVTCVRISLPNLRGGSPEVAASLIGLDFCPSAHIPQGLPEYEPQRILKVLENVQFRQWRRFRRDALGAWLAPDCI
jgi:hypothetical protein